MILYDSVPRGYPSRVGHRMEGPDVRFYMRDLCQHYRALRRQGVSARQIRQLLASATFLVSHGKGTWHPNPKEVRND